MSVEKTPSMKESPDRGKEVEIVLKFQRHGLRTGTTITPEGREITRESAKKSGWHLSEGSSDLGGFHTAKAIGSPADLPQATPDNPKPSSRAMETAYITAATIAGKRAGDWKLRPEPRLSFENIKTPRPYNHREIYNAALAQAIQKLGKGDLKQEDLTKEEQIKVTEEAQVLTIQHVNSLDTPEARAFKKENAGMFADLLEHYIKMTGFLKNKSRALYVAGTHGATMEWLLQEALVRTDSESKKKIGFESFDEIGGGFNSSEVYNVHILSDENGDLRELRVTFDNPTRPQSDMYLDADKLHELAHFYRLLRKDSNPQRQ